MPKIFFPASDPIFLDEEKIVSELRELSHKISEKFGNIKRIYLFGSYAEGNAGLRSDADILIVVSHDERPMMDRLDEFILKFADASLPVDVLVYTEKELAKAISKKNRFITNILESGLILFP